MRTRIRQLGLVFGLVVLATCAACRKDSGTEGTHGGKGGKTMRDQYVAGKAQQKDEEEKARPKQPPEPPPAPKLPEVKMPATLAETCLVKVGGSIPEVQLANLEGKQVALRSLFGKKLTVLLFWGSENLYATQALELLDLDVAKPFAEMGGGVVGVSGKDSPEAARKAVEGAGVKYPNLVDPKGEFFAKVATEKVPRVYLLDPTGKVLWLDIEYSSSTRRDLERAIKFVLGEK